MEPAEKLKPQTNFPNRKTETRIDQTITYPQAKRPSHASLERGGTKALDPGLREKGARREEKTHLLSLTERRRKRTLIHPQMEMNQKPAQRQKGWGLVRKDTPYKKKTQEGNPAKNKRELHRGL